MILSPPLPVIILVEPQLAENIGTVARAMLNFGLTRLRLVNPKIAWPSDRAVDVSSGAGVVLEAATVHRSLADAVGDLKILYATSARPRDMVKEIITPRLAAAELRAHAADGIEVGLLFGPERTGLINDDIALCDRVITVPLNPEFSSLNLAQAVVLLAYEWYQAEDETPPLSFRLAILCRPTKSICSASLIGSNRSLSTVGFCGSNICAQRW